MLSVALAVISLSALACGGGGGGAKIPTPTAAPINASDFQATIDNRLFPLSSLGLTVFERTSRADASIQRRDRRSGRRGRRGRR